MKISSKFLIIACVCVAAASVISVVTLGTLKKVHDEEGFDENEMTTDLPTVITYDLDDASFEAALFNDTGHNVTTKEFMESVAAQVRMELELLPQDMLEPVYDDKNIAVAFQGSDHPQEITQENDHGRRLAFPWGIIVPLMEVLLLAVEVQLANIARLEIYVKAAVEECRLVMPDFDCVIAQEVISISGGTFQSHANYIGTEYDLYATPIGKPFRIEMKNNWGFNPVMWASAGVGLRSVGSGVVVADMSETPSFIRNGHDKGLKCVDESYGTVKMQNCEWAPKQRFKYKPSTKQITSDYSSYSRCLTRQGRSVSFQYCRDNNAEQKWSYDSYSNRVKSDTSSSLCLDYYVGDGVLGMWECHSGSNQKFYVAEGFWGVGAIYHEADPYRCLFVTAGSREVHSWNCGEYTDQDFFYVKATRQIKNRRDSSLCLDGSHTDTTVVMKTCVSGRQSQKWEYTNKQLKTWDSNSRCLDFFANPGRLGMWNCHSGDNQKFHLPFSFFM